jgi:acyl-homoserine lactone acylase PvdQ
MVLDVGNWDESWFINAPGQSGDPRSPHYDDLAPLWAGRRYLPLLYSREAVDGRPSFASRSGRRLSSSARGRASRARRGARRVAK